RQVHEGIPQGLAQLAREGVQRLRAIEGERGDTVDDLDEQYGLRHGEARSTRRAVVSAGMGGSTARRNSCHEVIHNRRGRRGERNLRSEDRRAAQGQGDPRWADSWLIVDMYDVGDGNMRLGPRFFSTSVSPASQTSSSKSNRISLILTKPSTARAAEKSRNP